jgi:hypothetical protein
VKTADNRLAQLFLRYASPLAGLRRLPVLGPCLRWAGARMVPRDSLVWAQVPRGPAAGIWLRVNPRTGSDALEGAGEPEVQSALQEHLHPGMTFYDVGANIGFFSMLGAEGKAVWSQPRKVLFARADPEVSPDRGLGHVVCSAQQDTIELDAVSLDSYTRTSPMPDFIKCDVEGAEVEVFRGAQGVLAEKLPTMLCEMHGEENRRTLLDQFSRSGYRCSECGERHILALSQ